MGSPLRRGAVVLACAALVPPSALAAGATHSWAQPQIKLVTSAGLFAGTPATFQPTAPLTEGALARVLGKLTGTLARDPSGAAAPVSLEHLDRTLVGALGLRDAAYRFSLAARN